jgi:hypothetical protein
MIVCDKDDSVDRLLSIAADRSRDGIALTSKKPQLRILDQIPIILGPTRLNDESRPIVAFDADKDVWLLLRPPYIDLRSP